MSKHKCPEDGFDPVVWQRGFDAGVKSGALVQSKLDRLRGSLADAEGVIKRMHDHCLNRSKDIEAGIVKSKAGASHYLDQAIGLSHAMDVLGNIRPR